MSLSRLAQLLVAAFLVSIPARTQQPSAPTPPAPQRDPRALTVLSQMTAATGWTRTNIPADLLAQGVVIPFEAKTQDKVNITVKVKGFSRVRTEAQDGSDLSTTIVDGDRAAVISFEGTRFLPPQSVLSMHPWAFLFLSELITSTDDAVTVRYLGTDTIRGELTHGVEIHRVSQSWDNMAELRESTDRMTLWISATTWMPVEVNYNVLSEDDPRVSIPVSRYFTDYRNLGGLAVPFHQEVMLQGHTLYSLTWTQIQFNAGIPDSDFSVPSK